MRDAAKLENAQAFLEDIGNELYRAMEIHAPQHSPHESLAIIQEEFEEFKAEVFRKKRSREALYKELKQLAAMCVRAVVDCELWRPDSE